MAHHLLVYFMLSFAVTSCSFSLESYLHNYLKHATLFGNLCSHNITDPSKILLSFLCNVLNITAMCLNINVEAAEIIEVMQRENKRVLSGSIIIIDNYFGSKHYWVYCRQLRAVNRSNYLSNIAWLIST